MAGDAIDDKLHVLHINPDMEDIARKVRALFPDVPLLGVDLLQQAGTGGITSSPSAMPEEAPGTLRPGAAASARDRSAATTVPLKA